MKKASISDLKNRLSAYLDYVKEGDTILITDRNTPIAEIIPLRIDLSTAHDVETAYLESLQQRGLIKTGTGKLPKNISTPCGQPSGALQALLDERSEGR